jgi:hypothetical protein
MQLGPDRSDRHVAQPGRKGNALDLRKTVPGKRLARRH